MSSHHENESSLSHQEHRQPISYLGLIGMLMFFDAAFHGGVFPIISLSADSAASRNLKYSSRRIFRFQGRKEEMAMVESFNSTGNFSTEPIINESSLCVLQPNQPLTKLPYEVEDRPPSNQKGISHAFCRFHEGNSHFPHAMQQLYRCYSLWSDYYPRAKPILIIPTQEYLRELYLHPFTKGILTVFHVQMNMSAILEEATPPDQLDVYQNSDSTVFESYGEKDYSIRHTDFLHRIVQRHLELPDDSTIGCETSKPRIAILNRNGYHKRSILNAEEIAKALQPYSHNQSVPVKYFEGVGFKEQVAFFRSVDILLSPHGAQLTGVAFMNTPCAQLLELFPKKYHVPRFFGSLAIESDKEYSYIYFSQNSSRVEQTPRTRSERNQARATNLCPSIRLVVDAIHTLSSQWQRCCYKHLKGALTD